MCYLKHLFCFAAIVLLADAQKISTRILAGDPVLPEEYTYIASIRLLGDHYCGGTVVHEKWILTAAHCVFNQTEIELSVALGSTAISIGADFYKVKAIVIHELYQYITDVNAVNDIALLLLEDPIRFHAGTGKAHLASKMIQSGLNTVLIGWGRISQIARTPSNTLNRIALTTISNQECATLLPNRTLNIGNFCTGAARNQGGCYGDSGSPLIEQITGEVVGLYSWVVPPCGSGLPDGYTDIWEYSDWIQSHIEPYN